MKKIQLKKPRYGLVLALVLSLAAFSYARWQAREHFIRVPFESPVTEELREYAVVLPDGYEESTETWPAILYLHGLGEVGDDVGYLTRRGLLKEITDDIDIPFIVVAPQAAFTSEYRRQWRRFEEDVLTVLEDAQSKYRIDPDRIYLTGISMGGIGSFYLASQHPHLFAAVAPIAGEGQTAWTAEYHGLPFWVFHGLKDDVIPPSGSKDMVAAMRSNQVDVNFTEYPEADHDSWTETYRNPELYRWFLSHQRRGDGSS